MGLKTLADLGYPVLLTYGVLALSVVGLWLPLPYVWLALFASAVGLGLWAQVITWLALIPVLLLVAACYLIEWERPVRYARTGRIFGSVLIITVSLGLGMHAFPGFTNPLWLDRVIVSEAAAAYTLALNFDKALVGVLLLGLAYQGLIRTRLAWAEMFKSAAAYALGTIVLVMGLGLFLNFVHVDPKWAGIFWPWAMANLFFTCVAEEAFFRGFIQRRLQRYFLHQAQGNLLALVLSALLFGAAHFAGGLDYVLLASVAGLGYGWVYQRSKRIEAAILTHFSLNAVHFLLFTYPQVA